MTLKLVVLGADEPLAEALFKELEERNLPIAEVQALTLGEAETSVEFNGAQIPCQPVAGFDWNGAELVVVATRSRGARRHVDAALSAGRPVLGLGEVLAQHPQAVWLDPEHAEFPPGKLWLVPDAVASLTARVLRPLVASLGVTQVDGFANLAVSAMGQAGIDELREQVSQLFSLSAIDSTVFPLQIAFNLTPQVGDLLPDGESQGELATQTALQHLLGRQAPVCRLTLAWAPVFYGHSITLHLAGGAGLSIENVRTRLQNAPGVVLMDEHLPGGYPTPVTDAAESSDAFVGRLRASGVGDARFIQLWLVGDNVRTEAMNLAQIIERRVEKQ
ncbi:aspartate semialdehyde dehydrogenase [Sulfuritortus calidifontis]|uniref:Aspartate semialdehyde dehydrogenase n=1 Tax=Sulfuritortus calidifontis TaxID=1914471 RepID=A0A4R3JX99_9PROT|nr:Asd/ArgC dimerization domain-containing protein [Sulfuritortus calidifontis]TCS72944.1 aspartate semialdehyde dehydrogenase [Sulfuritortus calidifontis]